jgi:prevent-host-death family protein
MREFGAFEAKNKFGHLLDLVEHGEEVLITRHGKEVARLVPARPKVSRDARPCGASATARSKASSAVSTGRNGKPIGTKGVREPGSRQLRHACLDIW